MADGFPDSHDESGTRPVRDSITGTPRWVKVFAIIAVLLLLVLGVMLLAGGGPGGHGPGRHFSGGDPPAAERGRETPPSAVPEDPGRHTGPPPGVEHGP